VRILVTLVVAAGCGRLEFASIGSGASDAARDSTPDVSNLGHDEDGDGVPDANDVCPHVAGSQLDSDGDGVGDDCDPEPMNPRQHFALFATMRPGDQPFGFDPSSQPWEQREDALYFNGMVYGGLVLPLSAQNVVYELGADIISVQGGATAQHQLAFVETPNNPPEDFTEINEVSGFSRAAVTYFDGTNFANAAWQDLATGVHTGPVIVRGTELVGTSVRIDAGWPGEMYNATDTTTLYQGGVVLLVNTNNLELAIRYVVVITW